MSISRDEVEVQFSDYGPRAMAAYFRTGANIQPGGDVMQYTIRGKVYVVLQNVNGILAVYRIKSDGYLKGLRRWPAVLDEIILGPEGVH